MDRFEELREKIVPLLKPYVKRVAVFGSFAHGEDTPDSDIDLLVEFETRTHAQLAPDGATGARAIRPDARKGDFAEEKYASIIDQSRVQSSLFAPLKVPPASRGELSRGAPTRFPLRAARTLRRGFLFIRFCELWLSD
jgi:predicted nucleotidyltransferase